MSQVLDKKLYSAIESLNTKQKKAVLDIVKAFSEKEQKKYNDHWQDESFVAEMDARYGYYKNGGKMISAEDANKQIEQLLQKAIFA